MQVVLIQLLESTSSRERAVTQPMEKKFFFFFWCGGGGGISEAGLAGLCRP
jgi:hypothetical protein